MDAFNNWFWKEEVWLPPGTSWINLKTSGIGKVPDFEDLLLPVYYSFFILLIRAAFEWMLARPLGRWFGIADPGGLPHFFRCTLHRVRSVFHTEQLLVKANGTKRSSRGRSNSVSGILHLIHKKTVLDKFSESCWRFAYYFFIFIYGVSVLWNKPWLWNTSHCWYGYPYQHIDEEIRWYYLLELSFYWALMFSQFVDVVRKDFWVNFIHHVTTILLLSFSWMDNFVRVGSLVLIIHDAADFWLEGAKMARYCKNTTMCNLLFVVFSGVWFVTRCGIYPFKIIYCTTIEAPALVEFFPAYYIFNGLLFLLFALQLFWSFLILKIAINTVRCGETQDVRSDDEEEEEEEEDTPLDDDRQSAVNCNDHGNAKRKAN